MAVMNGRKQISTPEQVTAIVVAIGVSFLIICFGHVRHQYERLAVQTGAGLGAFVVILLWQIIAGRKKPPSDSN